MPFPIQRIQTDRGREFFAIKVQEQLMEWGIKFRPIEPASPYLNGKVERSQLTDLQEFCDKTPIEKFCELSDITPLTKDAENHYLSEKEHIQDPNYQIELRLRELKRSM